MATHNATIIEVHFPCHAVTIPSDHGYALYSAISRLVPEVHTADRVAIATIPGQAVGQGVTIPDPSATLRLRLPREQAPLICALAGETLSLNGHRLTLGDPWLSALAPAPRLDSRIVTIKGFTEPEPFQEAVNRKLQEMAIDGMPSVGPRRVVRVGDHKIVGFALAIHQLNDDASLLLQESGMGGRRRMGCGIFFPIAIDRVIGQPPQRVEKVSR